MKVPSGTHEIVFKMEPASYATGEALALVFSLMLFAISAVSIYFDFRTGGKDDESEVDATTQKV
jgi:hypothetical protein